MDEERQCRTEKESCTVEEGEVAVKAKKYEELQKIISAVDEVMENTALLDNIKSEAELEQVMPVLLSSLGKYAKADRSYIFELKPGSTELLHMRHVWCAQGISPTFTEMQDIFLSSVPNWFSILNNDGMIVSYDCKSDKDKWPEEYALFSGQGGGIHYSGSACFRRYSHRIYGNRQSGAQPRGADGKFAQRDQRSYQRPERKPAYGENAGGESALPAEKSAGA